MPPILILLEDLQHLPAALTKAARIAASQADTRILIRQVTYDAITEENLSDFDVSDSGDLINAIVEREQMSLNDAVEEQLEKLSRQGAEVVASSQIDSAIHWDKHKAKAMMGLIKTHEPSLVIKPLTAHRRIANLFHAPLDWTIMRESPVPVLFCHDHVWPSKANVLAAMDLGDDAHQLLNLTILREARALADALGGDLHLVSVYPMLGQELIQYQTTPDNRPVRSTMEAQRREAFAQLLDNSDIAVSETHVIEGRPRLAISELANRIDAQLTVVGTAGRKGLSKLVIGNTAEDIVRDMSTDLLTVRE